MRWLAVLAGAGSGSGVEFGAAAQSRLFALRTCNAEPQTLNPSLPSLSSPDPAYYSGPRSPKAVLTSSRRPRATPFHTSVPHALPRTKPISESVGCGRRILVTCQ